MHHCNTNKHSHIDDRQTLQLQSDVENIKNTIDLNIDLLMRRAGNLEDLIDQSDELLRESQAFNAKTNELKWVIRKKVWRYKIILLVFAILVLYLMLSKICGFNLSCNSGYSYHDRKKNNNGKYYNNDDGNNNDQNDDQNNEDDGNGRS